MKTPEEIALEYIKDVETARNPSVTATAFPQMQRCFLAGYQAAKDYNEDTLLAAFKAGSQSGNNVMPGLSGYIPDDFNDFLLSLPAKDQVADVSKVMFCVYCNDMHKGNCAIGKGKNHPAVGFSEIVVKIESSWVSVKEQNPEARKMVLVRHKTFGVQIGFIDDNHARPCRNRWIVYVREFEEDAGNHIPKTGKYEHIEITHWMELPAPPKEEK